MSKIYKLLTFVGLINLIILVLAVLTLPDIIPTHINGQNIVDGLSSRWIVATTGAFGLIIPLFVGGYEAYTKSKMSVARSKNAEKIIFILCSVAMVGLSWFTYAIAATGAEMGQKLDLPFDLIIALPMGLVFIILGNYMGVIKKNFYLGIRTPWTLMDDEVWRKTHRLGGYTFAIGGVLMIAFTLASHMSGIAALSVWGVLAAAIFGAGVPALYSFIIYAKKQRK